ncbi:MAG: MFS transporter, partial [Anaerolineae bacterium]
FYLCRVNLAVAAPVMRAELGWDVGTVGLIGGAFLWVYALGQLIIGTLGQRADARPFVLVGMLVSAACNLALGLVRQPWAMAVLWAVNGWAQSMGWGAIMKTIATWVDPARRGRIAALFSPCFVLGHLLAWTAGGWLASRWGWQYAFWAPAAAFAAMAVVWWWGVRSSPQAAGLAAPGSNAGGPAAAPPPAVGDILRSLVGSSRLRWAALTCAFASMIKDGLNLWAPTLLVDGLGMRVDRAAWAASVLPLLGLAGSSLAGWSSDRFFRSRESPGIVGLSLLVALAMLGLMAVLGGGSLTGGAPVLVVLLLGLCGVAMYGINSLLLTSLPLSFANVAAVAGFLDFASYVGGGISGLAAGQLLAGYGWSAVFGYWLAATVIAVAGGAVLGRRAV